MCSGQNLQLLVGVSARNIPPLLLLLLLLLFDEEPAFTETLQYLGHMCAVHTASPICPAVLKQRSSSTRSKDGCLQTVSQKTNNSELPRLQSAGRARPVSARLIGIDADRNADKDAEAKL